MLDLDINSINQTFSNFTLKSIRAAVTLAPTDHQEIADKVEFVANTLEVAFPDKAERYIIAALVFAALHNDFRSSARQAMGEERFDAFERETNTPVNTN